MIDIDVTGAAGTAGANGVDPDGNGGNGGQEQPRPQGNLENR